MQVEAKASPSLQQLIAKYSAMPSKVDAAIRGGVVKVTNEFKREVTGPEGLKKYPRHKKRTPTPSPPGQPPAQITTALRKSIKLSVTTKLGQGRYTKSATATMLYARAQELGNPRRNLPARPFMEPARVRVMKRARQLFMDQVERVLSRDEWRG